MWLELPVGVDTSDSNVACLEPHYYCVVLSLFSLLTHCVESGASEPGRGEGRKDDDNSGGLTDAAKVLLQTVLTVSTINTCMSVRMLHGHITHTRIHVNIPSLILIFTHICSAYSQLLDHSFDFWP